MNHIYQGHCPDALYPNDRDKDCPACRDMEEQEAIRMAYERLRTGLVAIEARWRAASRDTCFRRAYRDTIAECAAELATLLAGTDDGVLQSEIEKAMGE